MTRHIRLFTTLAGALALTAIVTVGLGRASQRPEPAASTDRPPATAAAVVAGAAGEEPAAELLARAAVVGRGQRVPGSDYQLERIPVAARVIMQLKDHYVDPSRFKPKEMLVAALEGVERKVAEVMVQGDARSPRLTLTVGGAQRELDISGVNSIWEIRTKLGEAMGFIQEHLIARQDLREIEYAAVNGMLSTLDPHTILLDPKSSREMKVQTRGEFGGLGFVIGMRDGNLTVVKVLKNTPPSAPASSPRTSSPASTSSPPSTWTCRTRSTGCAGTRRPRCR